MRLASLILAVALCAPGCRRSTLREALNDQEFWALMQAFSEAAGSFDLSENLVSNEPRVARMAGRLRPMGGVYIGVGPEQNFTYIARLRPRMAFIVDVRTENRNLHLLYKALFELASDRADFVSRLFSRPRPTGLSSRASVDEIFAAYERVPPSVEQFDRTMIQVRERLVTTHRLPLLPSDLDDIGHAFKAFLTGGPDIQFWGSRSVDADTVRPSYRQLMTLKDLTGQTQSFLASDGNFRFLQELHAGNRIVPIVGDFAGAVALRRIGEYARMHRDEVHAFYGSNVNVYLTNAQRSAFCSNLAGLPASSQAVFIDSDAVRLLATRLRACPAASH
jgi:hypothetical protein